MKKNNPWDEVSVYKWMWYFDQSEIEDIVVNNVDIFIESYQNFNNVIEEFPSIINNQLLYEKIKSYILAKLDKNVENVKSKRIKI